MKWALILSLSLSYAVYAWAFSRFFSRSGPRTLRLRLLAALGTVATLAQAVSIWFYLTPSALRIVLAIGLCLLALALFTSACRVTRGQPLPLAFDPARAARIVTDGPYRYVRHPFYISYSITWLAGALATSWWPAWLTAGLMLCAYAWVAASEEQALLQSHPDDYATYRARTGAFVPRMVMRNAELSLLEVGHETCSGARYNLERAKNDSP
jgi:protein-S-isoprenylcysteine O-methyltransferase Ste14